MQISFAEIKKFIYYANPKEREKVLTISRFNTIIGDGQFGFFVVAIFRSAKTSFLGFGWRRCGCRRMFALFCRITSITVVIVVIINATYSYCYWITFSWHSIALHKRTNTKFITNAPKNAAAICKYFDWVSQLVFLMCLFWFLKESLYCWNE